MKTTRFLVFYFRPFVQPLAFTNFFERRQRGLSGLPVCFIALEQGGQVVVQSIAYRRAWSLAWPPHQTQIESRAAFRIAAQRLVRQPNQAGLANQQKPRQANYPAEKYPVGSPRLSLKASFRLLLSRSPFT